MTLKLIVQFLVLTYVNFYPALQSSAARNDVQMLEKVQDQAAHCGPDLLIEMGR